MLGCSSTASVNVLEPAILSVNLTTMAARLWTGQWFYFRISEWSVILSLYLEFFGDTVPLVLNLAAGTYTVTVTDDHGCTKTSSSFVEYKYVSTCKCVQSIKCNV